MEQCLEDYNHEGYIDSDILKYIFFKYNRKDSELHPQLMHNDELLFSTLDSSNRYGSSILFMLFYHFNTNYTLHLIISPEITFFLPLDSFAIDIQPFCSGIYIVD